MNVIRDKLINVFQNTININTNLRYNGTITDIDYFSLYCKAASEDMVHKIMGSDLFMFNFLYESNNAVLMVFVIPINLNSGTKHIAERVIEIIENTEKCFITLDYSCSQEVKSDKFVYVTIVKKYNDELIQWFDKESIRITKKKKSKKEK